jgi:hypothetical protein
MLAARLEPQWRSAHPSTRRLAYGNPMAQPHPSAVPTLPAGVTYIATQSAARKDAFVDLYVRINNTFPHTIPAGIAGNCRFFFKKPSDDSDDGFEDVLRGTAIVPNDSVLVFRPTLGRSVKAFSINVRVSFTSTSFEDRTIDVGDPGPGLCWSRAEFDCGPAV